MILFKTSMQREKLAAIGLVIILVVAISGFLLLSYNDQIFDNLFDDADNSAPKQPKTPGPVAEAVNVDIYENLTWTTKDPDNDKLTYDVYLDNNNPPLVKVVNNESITSYSPTTLNYNTTYYWKVIARDPSGAETESPVWEFTTIEPQVQEGNTVELNDCVIVNYIGKFQVNDTIFDTSYENIAIDEGLYDENRTYQPLKIFVDPEGDDEIPDGFSDYTTSMLVGFLKGLPGANLSETKEITVIPEEGYGVWNTSLAEMFGFANYPLDTIVNKTASENITTFVQSFPNVTLEAGNTFDYGAEAFQEEGSLDAEIIELSDTNVTYKLLPEDGKVVSLPIFNWNVSFIVTNDSAFTMHSMIEDDHTFTIDSFYGSMHFKVLSLNDTHAVFGMNIDSPKLMFVNQTLIFEVTVEKIYKTSTL